MLGLHIRSRRREMGLTQKQLAEGICSASLLSMAEAGRAHLSQRTLVRLAERLQVSVRDLLQTDDGQEETVSRFRIGVALLDTGDWRSAAELFLMIPEEEQVKISRYDWLFAQARCRMLSGQLEEALQQLEEAFERATALQDEKRVWESLWRMGQLEENQGQCALAYYHYRRALRVLQRGRVHVAEREAMLCSALGRLSTQMGRHEEAMKWLERALSLAVEQSHLQEELVVWRERTLAHLAECEVERALSCGSELMRLQAELERRQERMVGMRLYAYHLVQDGRAEEAFRWYRAAVSEWQGCGDWAQLGQLYGEMAACLLRTGRLEAAADIWKQLLADATSFQGTAV